MSLVTSHPRPPRLAIFGDYVPGGVSNASGSSHHGTQSRQHPPRGAAQTTEWVLCDIRMHALIGGYAQGVAFLWSQDGELLATASQSMAVRLWPEDADLAP